MSCHRWPKPDSIPNERLRDARSGNPRLKVSAESDGQRIGRILIGRGRDAADVPIAYTFGPDTLVSIKVWTDQVG